jgi:hypothetical protein
MKVFSKILLTTLILISLFSCEKEQGKIPTIKFKSGSGYTYESNDIVANSSFKIGIDAYKSETRDYLSKITVTKSINNGEAVEVFSKDLSKSERDTYTYDYSGVAGSTSDETEKFTFKMTSKNGLTNEVYLTLSVQ